MLFPISWKNESKYWNKSARFFEHKRESLNSAETALNLDALGPSIDNMLECRKIGADKINQMYGTNISVKLSSSWADNAEEITLALASINKSTLNADDKSEVNPDDKSEVNPDDKSEVNADREEGEKKDVR